MFSDSTRTAWSNSSRFRRYAGFTVFANHVVSPHIRGVVARHATVSIGWMFTMYTRYSARLSPSSSTSIITPSMNCRTACTSPVTRLMIEPDSLASKNRNDSRCSMSYTIVRRSVTMFITSRAFQIWLNRSSTNRAAATASTSPASTNTCCIAGQPATYAPSPSGHCGTFASGSKSATITSIPRPVSPSPDNAITSSTTCSSTTTSAPHR